jgi:hypothetical protein
MEAQRTGGDEWRVEVNLDDPEHGYTLSERLHSLDLTPELEDRLGNRVIVTRDGPKVFVYSSSEEQAKEAEKVVREILEQDDLSGTLRVTRWHPVEEAWKDASEPLPESDAEREAEYARRVAAEEAEAEIEGEYDWEVRVDLPHMRDAHDLAERLRDEGRDVTRRWRHLFVGAPTEEAAAELAKRLESEAPEGSEVHVQPTDGIPHPLFVWLGAADPRSP